LLVAAGILLTSVMLWFFPATMTGHRQHHRSSLNEDNVTTPDSDKKTTFRSIITQIKGIWTTNLHTLICSHESRVILPYPVALVSSFDVGSSHVLNAMHVPEICLLIVDRSFDTTLSLSMSQNFRNVCCICCATLHTCSSSAVVSVIHMPSWVCSPTWFATSKLSSDSKLQSPTLFKVSCS